jgi:hypothetical protein
MRGALCNGMRYTVLWADSLSQLQHLLADYDFW